MIDCVDNLDKIGHGKIILTVGDDGHVTDVRGPVHEPTDLVYGSSLRKRSDFVVRSMLTYCEVTVIDVISHQGIVDLVEIYVHHCV